MGAYIIKVEGGAEVGIKDTIHPPMPWLWIDKNDEDETVAGVGLTADEARQIAHALLEVIGEAPAP